MNWPRRSRCGAVSKRPPPPLNACRENAAEQYAETINGPYKAEVIRRRGPWRSLEAVEFATLEWVDWFNNRRLLSSIGNIPPAEADMGFQAGASATTNMV